MHAPNRIGTSLPTSMSCIITLGKDEDDSGQGSVSSRNIRERASRHQETEEQRELGLQARWNEVGSERNFLERQERHRQESPKHRQQCLETQQ